MTQKTISPIDRKILANKLETARMLHDAATLSDDVGHTIQLHLDAIQKLCPISCEEDVLVANGLLDNVLKILKQGEDN